MLPILIRKSLPLEVKVVRQQRGFTLLEVLIAIVVMAIGILGLAAMQTRSLSQGQGSLQASQALALAYDYADRMRANPVAAYAGQYEVPNPASLPSSSGTSCFASGSTAPGACTTSNLAAYDQSDWLTQVQALLPGGTARVKCADNNACATGAPQTVTITVFWQQRRPGGGVIANPTYNCGTSAYDDSVNSNDLPCVSLSFQPS